jgi:alanyl-tRNA synthetase
MNSREIRKAFLDFFESKQHKIVPSAPMVVQNDPTLMFINSGMAPFKDIFLGNSPVKYPRIADTQKCLRVSGKHNDLEEVGIDTYHHTMFEMLGNWSFGDYFKHEAINWSWELLTEVYKLDKDRLYVTVFEGDEKEGIPASTIALNEWKKLVPESRILMGNKKDNFWEMGDTGPCGPCSEIHMDCRSDEERKLVDGATLVNKDHPQVIEIWNNVFMQYSRMKDGSLQPLPAKHVDTGMGFERLVRVIQNKQSNYDTDIFQPLIQFISKHCGIAYGNNEKTDIAMRVMSDHIRAIAFCIGDGQLPSNVKAGYVIRRILRRAVRYAYTFLDIKEPFLYKLTDILAEQFEGVFTEIVEQKEFIKKVIMEEEASFLRTLASGIQRFEKYQVQNNTIEGSFAFELFDTYGFPIDLTQLMASEKGCKVDIDGFNKALEEQKTRSRAATLVDTDDWVMLQNTEESVFVGYDEQSTESEIIKYRKVTAKGKELYQLVLNLTPFYAESGGQVGDKGSLTNTSDTSDKVFVLDTKKENNQTIHITEKLPKNLQAKFMAEINVSKRAETTKNHSATHLMHAALKQVLGQHVNQKGSLVNEEYLRFDFSHFAKMTDEEIEQVEKIVNDKIAEQIALKEQRNVPYQEALNSGVTALFGEKYGDFVRVITFDDAFSKELCGGTHVKNTSEIALFRISSESAVSAGVRRIEAITSTKALNYLNEQAKLLESVKSLLKNPVDVYKSLELLIEDHHKSKKLVEKFLQEKAATLKQELKTKFKELNGIQFLAEQVALADVDLIKNLLFELREEFANAFILLAAEIDAKPHLALILSDSLVETKKLNASQIIRELGKEIQGGGGGQAFFATAGGKNTAGINNAIAKALEMIKG